MYKTIYVPVDNSAHSNRAIDRAVALGRGFESEKLVGCHVYAAKMHDYRFKQMEYTLPDEYLVERELSRQRKIHDSLITMGLELISDCYLQDLDQKCQAAGLPCERKMMDGKHSTEIIRDVQESDYDLIVLGAVGIGRTKDSQIGSVCARVTREITTDTWVVKHVPKAEEPERDTILVAVDGSPESFGALRTGIELAKRFDKRLEVVGVYDPYLHYAVFKGIVEVLTDQAAKVFRFEEQNQLHEEIIDTGLAQIYQSHINVAETIARKEGVEVSKTLLDGKAFQKILDHARKVEPWVMILGHVGVHVSEEERGLGSNTEYLLRLAPCDLLLTSRRHVPELDLKAEESIHWTPEAEERMTRVPEQVKGIARTAILRLALEQGHSVVSSDLVTEAMERFMPKRSAEMTERLAEALAFEKAKKEPVSVCTQCGVAARVPDPVTCTVCGESEFEVVSQDMLAQIVADEGGAQDEVTYDGRKLAWTQEARKALRAIDDRYQRRRAKARIEKNAHGKRLQTVTLEMAQRFIEEETGVLYKAAETSNGHTANGHEAEATDNAAEARDAATQAAPEDDDPELKILARDAKDHPFLSRFDWTSDGLERILRVPSGFMRDRTQRRVEELAAEKDVSEIDLALVEEGIEHGKRMMAEMLGQVEKEKAEKAGRAQETGSQTATPSQDRSAASDEETPPMALNEVSVMAEMEKKRQDL